MNALHTCDGDGGERTEGVGDVECVHLRLHESELLNGLLEQAKSQVRVPLVQ